MLANKKGMTYTILLFFLITCFCAGCTSAKEPVTKSGFYFDTIITVTLYDGTTAHLDECFELADTYEQLFSATIADSDISKINHASCTPISVHPETLELINKGLYYSNLSDGRFDITIGELTSLWDFSGEKSSLPNPSDIKHALSTIGYKQIVIKDDTVTLTNPDTHIDLGGIAKGYIADKMKEYLMDAGVTEGFINLGGNVLCLDAKSDHTPYRIGIQKPFAETGTAMFSVDVTTQTVVTSGIYERYFEKNDTIYHHILDTSTGYPYNNGLLSVTIICNHSADADALSTTCFALGLEDGLALIESLPDTEAIFITDDYKLHPSSGMGDDGIAYHELN